METEETTDITKHWTMYKLYQTNLNLPCIYYYNSFFFRFYIEIHSKSSQNNLKLKGKFDEKKFNQICHIHIQADSYEN